MKTSKPTILETARERVAELENEAKSQLAKKQKLEALAHDEKNKKENPTFFVPVNRFGRMIASLGKGGGEARRIVNNDERLTDDTRMWLRKNAPDKLPQEPTAPLLTTEQKAKLAHSEYVDVCNRLQAARNELGQLEKRVADFREVMRCVQA